MEKLIHGKRDEPRSRRQDVEATKPRPCAVLRPAKLHDSWVSLRSSLAAGFSDDAVASSAMPRTVLPWPVNEAGESMASPPPPPPSAEAAEAAMGASNRALPQLPAQLPRRAAKPAAQLSKTG